MLGFDVTVRNPIVPLTGPDDPQALLEDRLPATRLGGWSAHTGVLDWLDQLCKDGHGKRVAINGGYPVIYVIRGSAVLPFLTDPPGRKDRLSRAYSPPDALSEVPQTPDLWLQITAWDQS